MPLYTWKCPSCGVVWEQSRKMAEPPPDCGFCDKHPPVQAEKVITPTRFRISKGHSWYQRNENGDNPFDGIGRF